MNLIVAVDENWAIGYKGDLLAKISEDLKYFKQKTLNNIVVMGRVTFESLPSKKPLKNRTNIVLTNDKTYQAHDVVVCHTTAEVLQISNNCEQETFIIGGEQIYKLFLPYYKKAYITKIYHRFEADRHLPNFVETNEWEVIEQSDIFITNENVRYQFLVYERKNGT